MTFRLFLEAIAKFAAGVVLVGGLLFLPAGTLTFPNGWLLMGLMFIPMFIAGIIMMVKNPLLLKKRLNGREKLESQGLVIKLSGLMFALGFLAAGLGYRLHWPAFPPPVVSAAIPFFLIAYLLYGEVLRENAYLSRTIEVQEGQRVVDTGLYALVRHPMYAATLILFLSIPLILGSPCSLLIFLAYPFFLVRRLKDEETLLEKELPGYQAYQQKVRWRLIPFLW